MADQQQTESPVVMEQQQVSPAAEQQMHLQQQQQISPAVEQQMHMEQQQLINSQVMLPQIGLTMPTLSLQQPAFQFQPLGQEGEQPSFVGMQQPMLQTDFPFQFYAEPEQGEVVARGAAVGAGKKKQQTKGCLSCF